MNHLMYDTCSTEVRNQQSASPYQHIMDINRYENCKKCFPDYGILGGATSSTIETLDGGAAAPPSMLARIVSVENDLFNLTRPGTKCPSYQYMPPTGCIVTGREYIKPVVHPGVNTCAGRNVDSCTFIGRPAQPTQPNFDIDRSCVKMSR
jgi:hypothetical protein